MDELRSVRALSPTNHATEIGSGGSAAYAYQVLPPAGILSVAAQPPVVPTGVVLRLELSAVRLREEMARAALDEAFAGMADDAEYQEEAARLAGEFRHADAEALRLGDEARGDAAPD
jgi:hypothetical protein